MDGRTIPGKITQTPGGVGRNLADSLGKISEQTPFFVSAVGNDPFGQFLLQNLHHTNTKGVNVDEKSRTATYCAIIDRHGEAKLGVGDMEINQTITKDKIKCFENYLQNASILIIDGNPPQETIEFIIEYGRKKSIPVWFEPTDIQKSVKPFQSDLWKSLSCISPNMNEVREMAKAIGVDFTGEFDVNDAERLIQQVTHLAKPLAQHIPIIMVTMGKMGILMVSCQQSTFPLRNVFAEHIDGSINARYYPITPVVKYKNALGAGDSGAAGFIDGMLRGLTEPECVSLGHSASLEALQSHTAIPPQFKYDKTNPKKAEFHEIIISSQ